MTAISAASVGVKTMADGTLRITFDVEPGEAGSAFSLFGKPGTPAALAALMTGYAAKPPEVAPEATPEVKPKGGPLSKEAALLCQNPAFQYWLRYFVAGDVHNCEKAAQCVRDLCGVESRAEFDTDAAAGQRFIEKVRIPFMRDTRENWNGQAARP